MRGRRAARTGGSARGGLDGAIAGTLAAALWAAVGAAQAPAGVAQAPESPESRTVVVEARGSTLQLPVADHHGYPVVEVTHLTGTLLADVTLGRDEVSGRLAGETLHLRAGSPFFRHGARVFQLGNPPYAFGGRLWVPAELVTDWMSGTVGSGRRALAGNQPVGEAVSGGPRARSPGPWRVVIDPGHGGKDPGTQAGRGRTREKDVVLGIARRLRDNLAAMPDIEPILTRERDMFLTVRGRPNLALSRQGDLFISIHANSAPNRSARGFETYFLGEARTDESREVAMRENRALEFEENAPQLGDIQFILASNDLSGYRRESNKLGGYIQNALRRVHPGPDRGVKPGPYWVLVGASGSMPTVLLEVGFISNPEEETFLAGSTGQGRLADALADAVRGYLVGYGQQIQAVTTLQATGGSR